MEGSVRGAGAGKPFNILATVKEYNAKAKSAKMEEAIKRGIANAEAAKAGNSGESTKAARQPIRETKITLQPTSSEDMKDIPSSIYLKVRWPEK